MTILTSLFSSTILVFVGIIILTGLKIVKQYERGVKFTLGQYVGQMEPGLRFVFPIIQTWVRVDIRTTAIDVPNQEAITKDNVSLEINAVLYYSVIKAPQSILEVEHFKYAISQLAQTTMRDVVGETTLDQTLTNREVISKRIKELVDKATDPWGIKIESVELKHIELPNDLKRVMAREAEAEREKRAVIIKAEGEVIASKNLSLAANKLSKTPGALHIRTLHSINDLSSDKSQTTIYAIPAELLRLIKKYKK